MKRLSLFLQVACFGAALAQTPDTAIIQLSVTDQAGGRLDRVHIIARNTSTGLERNAFTDAAGEATIAGLPAGSYNVSATKAGFTSASAGPLTAAGGTTAAVQMQLAVSGGVTQVLITGVVGEVRTDAPQLGTRFDAVQMQETPILNRRATFLPLLNAANRPAVNQGDVFMNQFLFTTNGSGRRQTTYVVDGSTGNDTWGRQTVFTALPLSSVSEMTVLTNAFSAEFGSSAGAVVNIVTSSGTDRFHGEVIEVWRPAPTAAALSGFNASNAPSGNAISEDTFGHTAAALSGPVRSPTHFSTAIEFSRQNRVSPVTSPVAPQAFLGRYRGWLGFLRLDRSVTNGNVFFRGNVDAAYDTNPNGTVGGNTLPSVGRVFHRRTSSFEVGHTIALSPSLLNNVRAQFQLGSPITQFDPVIYGTQFQVPISTGGTFVSGTSQSALLQNRQYQIADTVSFTRQRHQVKFGGDLVFAHNGGNSKEFGGPLYLGQFVYNTCTAALVVCESPAYLGNIANVRTYTQSYGNARYAVNDTLWAIFVQDDFRIRPDLTVNLGVRYERQTFTDAAKNFAPRLGFAYNVGGEGKTVVRGGIGLYYSQIIDNAAANWALTGPTGVFNYAAAPGQVGFPATVAAAPLPEFPAGARPPLRSLYVRPGDNASLDPFFPTSTLAGYQSKLLNPYSEQWTLGIQRRFLRTWVVAIDYIGSHTVKINRPLDVNPPSPFVRTAPGQVRSAQAANCTRPYWMWWYREQGKACNPAAPTDPQPPYSVILSDVNNGHAYYQSVNLNLTHTFANKLSLLASYAWSHTVDNVDPDVPGGNPNDPNFTGKVERANAIFDERHRFVLSGFAILPGRVHAGGIATLASGLPFNYVTGVNNSGDTGATTDRPVIDGVVVGRNAGRGRPIYEISPFLERPFAFRDRVRLVPRLEVFNVLNHPNFVGYSGTYGNGPLPGAGFGAPLTGITNQLPPRSVQFSIRLAF